MKSKYSVPTNAQELNDLVIVLRKTFTKEQRMKLFGRGMTNTKVVEILNAELEKRKRNDKANR